MGLERVEQNWLAIEFIKGIWLMATIAQRPFELSVANAFSEDVHVMQRQPLIPETPNYYLQRVCLMRI